MPIPFPCPSEPMFGDQLNRQMPKDYFLKTPMPNAPLIHTSQSLHRFLLERGELFLFPWYNNRHTPLPYYFYTRLYAQKTLLDSGLQLKLPKVLSHHLEKLDKRLSNQEYEKTMLL